MVSDTNTGVNFLNSITGLIGKAVDVAPDIYALKNGINKNPPIVGSVYPSGASNPAAVVNEKVQEKAEKNIDGTYTKYALFALIGIVVIGGIAYAVKKA